MGLSEKVLTINDFSWKKQLAVDLFDAGVFQSKKNPSGSAPFCFNFKLQPNGPVEFEIWSKIGRMIYMETRDFIQYNRIAGVSSVSDVFAHSVYDMITYESMGRSYISCVKVTKSKIEGKYKKGDRVFLITDTTAKTKNCFKTIRLLEKEGLKIIAIMAIIDQEEGGSEALREAGYLFSSLLTTYHFLMSCMDTGRISYKMYEKIRDYRRSARGNIVDIVV
ncbi:MAG: hypothetical protein U9P63_01310 [Patescibacteria group bacterium]|nr:hypothetical protein [Patescibacteria group bacterium]